MVHRMDLVGHMVDLMAGLMTGNDLVMLSNDVLAVRLFFDETTHQDLFTAIVYHDILRLGSLLCWNIHIYILVIFIFAASYQTQYFRVSLFDVELIPSLCRWTFVFLVVIWLVPLMGNGTNVAASIDFVTSH